MSGIRIVVCGGRDLHDADLVNGALDAEARSCVIDCIIEGDAPGADALASEWAKRHGINNLKFPADWKSFGPRAGPIRNRKMMLDGKPDLVLAFPGGRGTQDCVRQAKAAGVPVRMVGE